MKSDKKPLSCTAAHESMFDFIDGQLKESQKKRLEAHLEGCEECRAELEKRRKMLALIGSVDMSAPAELRENVMRMIEDVPQNTDNHAAKILTPKKKFIIPWGTIAAACAVVMILIAGRGAIGIGGDAADMVAEAEIEQLRLNSPEDAAFGGNTAADAAAADDVYLYTESGDVVIETTSSVTMLSPSATAAPEAEKRKETTISSLDNLLLSVMLDTQDSAALLLYASDFAGLAPDSAAESITLNDYEIIRYLITENAEDTFGSYVDLLEKNKTNYRVIIPEGSEFDTCEIWLLADIYKDEVIIASHKERD